MMTPEEAKEKYESEWPALNALKEDAIAKGDKEGIKRARRRLSHLSEICYDRFTLDEEFDESIICNDENKIGVILPDATFYQPGFDQRSGRVMWFKDLNDFKDGAVLYAVPINEGE